MQDTPKDTIFSIFVIFHAPKPIFESILVHISRFRRSVFEEFIQNSKFIVLVLKNSKIVKWGFQG